jgi:hypothetical protein
MSASRVRNALWLLALMSAVALAYLASDRCPVAYGLLVVFLVPLALAALVGPWSAEDRSPGLWIALTGLLAATVILALLRC